MKKIVALVLSLVMALSLATVAFAAVPIWTDNASQKFDKFNSLNEKIEANLDFTFHAAKAPTKTTLGNIAYWTKDGEAGKYYVMSSTYVKDFDFVLKIADDTVLNGQTSKDASYYMTEVKAVDYKYTGSLFTGWGKLCGQYEKPDNADDVDYLKFTMNDETVVYAAADKDNTRNTNPEWNVLVDGTVYTAAGDELETLAHRWVASAYDKKTGDVTEYTCQTCKTKAVVLADAFDPAGAGKTVENLNGTLIAFSYTPGTPASDKGGVESAKTFDAGIAMYVGMSLLSVAGGAVVIGKKKEF